MFYFVFIFIILTSVMLFKERSKISTRYIIAMMISYTLALLSLSLYLSKDVFYYNTIKNFFSIPLPVWKQMMFFSISKEAIIRMINLFTLGTILGGTLYALSFHPFLLEKHETAYKRSVIILLTLELFFYDPFITRILYLHFYPAIFSFQDVQTIGAIFHAATMLLNILLVLANIFIIYLAYRKSAPFKIMKRSTGSIVICYSSLMLSYLFIFGAYPTTLIKVSKIADITTYLSAPIIKAPLLTTLFPYYLIIAFLLVCYSIYQSGQLSEQMENESFTLIKQISASDTTSKAFCHYIKNEILAIQSELEILDLDTQQQDSVNRVINRCNTLYKQLDILYKNTKTSTLTEADLEELLKNVVSQFTYEFNDCDVCFQFQRKKIMVLIDPTYFSQAVHNILSNAADAMAELPQGTKKLGITVSLFNRWVQISISDNGKGISSENLSRIFTPFFSTQPISQHWGIGLSLTYKIIEAHEGHISIESAEGKGTTVKIRLPCLK